MKRERERLKECKAREKERNKSCEYALAPTKVIFDAADACMNVPNEAVKVKDDVTGETDEVYCH